MKTLTQTVTKILARFAALTLAALFATAALAQDSGTTGDTGDQASGPATSFPIGTDPEVQVGQTYSAEVFGDWELICIKQDSGPEPCEIGQLILDDKGTPVSDVRIFPLPPGGQAITGGTFILPLGVQLQPGMNLAVDDKDPKNYPFFYCNNVGCVSQVGFTPLELEALRKGTAGKVSFLMVGGQQGPLTLTLSLKGFSAAYAELSKRMIALQNAQPKQ